MQDEQLSRQDEENGRSNLAMFSFAALVGGLLAAVPAAQRATPATAEGQKATEKAAKKEPHRVLEQVHPQGIADISQVHQCFGSPCLENAQTRGESLQAVVAVRHETDPSRKRSLVFHGAPFFINHYNESICAFFESSLFTSFKM